MEKNMKLLLALSLITASLSLSANAANEQSAYWLSAMAGNQRVDDSSLFTSGWGAYFGTEASLVGLRMRYGSGYSGVRHSGEQSLLIGLPLAQQHRAWIAAGISRVEFERRRDPGEDGAIERLRAGLPMELVWAPHGSHFGWELRAEANLNGAKNSYLFGMGLEFGRLK
ncbi:hypothetical protein SAMN04488038_10913 [Solimonas aquatica]|uniref:Outer membrane protein beta-barrel domain-containing protein n=2 Tax=Solimonas aquatica TaxID=489703 RepID=A0A1H9HSI9_9GAMM|nr:hypothetical protein SAMN04488038_10913 [Solimonas aquatica]